MPFTRLSVLVVDICWERAVSAIFVAVSAAIATAAERRPQLAAYVTSLVDGGGHVRSVWR